MLRPKGLWVGEIVQNEVVREPPEEAWIAMCGTPSLYEGLHRVHGLLELVGGHRCEGGQKVGLVGVTASAVAAQHLVELCAQCADFIGVGVLPNRYVVEDEEKSRLSQGYCARFPSTEVFQELSDFDRVFGRHMLDRQVLESGGDSSAGVCVSFCIQWEQVS